YKIKDYARLFLRTDRESLKVEIVKKSISEDKPVLMAMNTPPSFQKLIGKDVWQPTEKPSGSYGGHAMTVIGYDDKKYGGAFEIQNSWGTGWGKGGYIWIKYHDFANFTRYAIELIDDPKPKPAYVPDLSGKLKFVLASGGKMPAKLVGQQYQMKRAYYFGTRFRIYISNNEPAYVYALALDKNGNVSKIFPHRDNISPALTYKRNEVPIPDEYHYIGIDNTGGSDFLGVLYAKDKLDINTLRRQLERTRGSFANRLKKVLGNQLVDPSNIKYAISEIGFSATSRGKKVVALIVEIRGKR
ncbi:MAG: cysteine protease, partial [Candidatus Parabeggiatoa sp. nov. 1]